MIDLVLVFISHTQGMKDHPEGESFLDGAEEAINALDGAKAHHMAFFPAADVSPAEYSIRHLKKADIFVAVIGFDYGSRVPDDSRSYTELEFDTATQLGKERLIFLLDPESADLQRVRLADVSADQNRFRNKLERSGATFASFTDAGDLKFKISQAVAQSIRERRTRSTAPQPIPVPSPDTLRKGTRIFGLAASISAFLLIAAIVTVGLLVWSAFSGVFPPWESQEECTFVTGRVTDSSQSTFGPFESGAALDIVVENAGDQVVSLPASRDVIAQGETGRQYAPTSSLDDRSWFFEVEIQPSSSVAVQLGLASADGGSDTITVVIPAVRTSLLSRCEVTLAPVEVSFAK